jgi:hypothetical protein
MRPCRASAERKPSVASGARSDGLEVMVAAGEVSRLVPAAFSRLRKVGRREFLFARQPVSSALGDSRR